MEYNVLEYSIIYNRITYYNISCVVYCHDGEPEASSGKERQQLKEQVPP